ncbi:MAG: alpha/beta hydrolase fold domain-containing protein, partial [Clostridia bacterium]
MIYFHGGGYLAEMTWKHWDFIDKLTNDTGSLIILIDYPLAPKYNCKDVFEVIEPLYKEITKKVNVENIIMMGDSAGGGLVLALEEKIGKEKLPQPSKTILISPWLDVTMKNPKEFKALLEMDS